MLKSTITSARSAGASTSCVTGTGASHKPPSAPICDILTPGISRFRIRALQPFRMRNRYKRGSTSRNGQTFPLTSITSPKYSPIQVTPGMVAGRVKERPVRVELPVLDDQRDLVGSTRNPDRVRLPASVELVAEDVGGGEPGEHVQPRRAQTMVVEPQERRRHLRQLVRVEDGLRLPGTKSVWRDRGVTVAVGGNKPTVKMGHHPHLVAERR